MSCLHTQAPITESLKVSRQPAVLTRHRDRVLKRFNEVKIPLYPEDDLGVVAWRCLKGALQLSQVEPRLFDSDEDIRRINDVLSWEAHVLVEPAREVEMEGIRFEP